jgi:hypothetical protein
LTHSKRRSNNGLARQVVLGSLRGHRPSRHSPSDPASQTEPRHRLKCSIRDCLRDVSCLRKGWFVRIFQNLTHLHHVFIQSRTLDLDQVRDVARADLPPPSSRAADLRRQLQSYRRAAVSPCGPLQRDWRSAAFLRRAGASGPLSRGLDCWRRLAAALSTQAPPPRERLPLPPIVPAVYNPVATIGHACQTCPRRFFRLLW